MCIRDRAKSILESKQIAAQKNIAWTPEERAAINRYYSVEMCIRDRSSASKAYDNAVKNIRLLYGRSTENKETNAEVNLCLLYTSRCV